MARLTEFEVVLEAPIQVSVKGQMQPCDTVLLVAPKGRHARTCDAIAGIHSYAQKQFAKLQLESGFNRQAEVEPVEQPKEDAEDKKEENKGEALKSLILMGIGDDEAMVDRLTSLARKLLTSGCCKIGDKDITDHIIDDRMDFRDYNKIVWEYLDNFLLTS